MQAFLLEHNIYVCVFSFVENSIQCKRKDPEFPNFCNIIFFNTISENPREWMFSVQISLLVVTFPSHTSHILTLK